MTTAVEARPATLPLPGGRAAPDALVVPGHDMDLSLDERLV
jgi:hypothetical protein